MSRAVAHPILGFYGPGSQMWRVNREAVLLLAGPAALLLQIAHPLVAEGVAAHSAFETDPFGRLRRTLRTTMAMVFGAGPDAERAIRRLNGVHKGVSGEVHDAGAKRASGASTYRALDAALLLWVQATLIVTSVRAYETWVGRLEASHREAFWQEARRESWRLGIPPTYAPPTWPELAKWFDDQLRPGGPIVVTDTARSLAAGIVRPPLPLVPASVVDLAVLPGLALLPARIRDDFDISWTRRREVLAEVLHLAIRAWVTVTPSGWRAMPQARSAERRVGRARQPEVGRLRDRGEVLREAVPGL